MRIDDNLNLVLPVREDDNGNGLAWAIHSPISREAFEASFRILSLARTEIFSKGTAYAFGTGPNVATLVLKDEGRRDGEQRGETDPEKAAKSFLMEIRRLTMIVAPSSEGFRPVPVDSAIASGLISREEWEDAESALVFFTLTFCLAKRTKWAMAKKATAEILGGQMVSSTPTEWAASCRKSTPVEPTQAVESSETFFAPHQAQTFPM